MQRELIIAESQMKVGTFNKSIIDKGTFPFNMEKRHKAKPVCLSVQTITSVDWLTG